MCLLGDGGPPRLAVGPIVVAINVADLIAKRTRYKHHVTLYSLVDSLTTFTRLG